MVNLAHSLCQRGPPVHVHQDEHPPIVRDIFWVFNNGLGRRVRLDAKGIVSTAASLVSAAHGSIAATDTSAIRVIREFSSVKAKYAVHTVKEVVVATSSTPNIRENGNKCL